MSQLREYVSYLNGLPAFGVKFVAQLIGNILIALINQRNTHWRHWNNSFVWILINHQEFVQRYCIIHMSADFRLSISPILIYLRYAVLRHFLQDCSDVHTVEAVSAANAELCD